ncbi:MAG: type II toxin-antitoxin system RelE/ParE family toxin [Chitinophagaceae bacterium]|nr:type II toxin-antitoxin system RelE/ParE family toxin [Chitinophagaceae bacterium]
MAFSIIITPIAQQHIENAEDYYFKKANAVIALNFYNELQNCYSILESNPYFQIRVKNYRALPMKNFPYLIFFELLEKENKVKILAVFQSQQDTEKYP